MKIDLLEIIFIGGLTGAILLPLFAAIVSQHLWAFGIAWLMCIVVVIISFAMASPGYPDNGGPL